jgi:hypothetical protein
MVDTNSTQTLSGKTLTAPTINAATLTGTLSGGTFTTTTLTSPTIGNFTNATHNHTSAATGGIVAHSALSGSGSNAHSVIDTHLAATATHGATGAVVGTTNSQTLTNKTLTAPVLNSVPVSSTMAGDPTAALAIATKQYVDKWPVTCTVRRGSDQTLNSSQIIAWNTEEHDPEGIHSGGTVTAPTGATRVRLTYWLKITGGGSASSVAIRKNGTDITAEHLTPVGDTDYQYCQTPWLTCAGGNTFDVYFTWVANCTLRYSTAITTPTTISLDKIGSWLYSYFTVEFSL